MRREFKKFIVDAAEKDDSIILIVSDFGYGIIDEFKKQYPNRFFNLGVCEQSIIGIAAGMALERLKPYVPDISHSFPHEPVALHTLG